MTGRERANLRQIANALGLSVTTVSRALKDGPEVHPDTIRRVKIEAEAAGYVPNLAGRALRTGSTRILTAILPMETRDYLSDIAKLPLIEGMTLEARSRGYSLNVFSTTPEESPEENLTNVLLNSTADGVVITRMKSQDPRIPFLIERKMPFIAFGRTDIQRDYAFVDIDNEKIAFEATRDLLELGCRRIALQVLTLDDQSSAARMAGYTHALRSAGLAVDPVLVSHEAFTMEASERWMQSRLCLPDPPTALVCANELGLLGALSALRSKGRVVGQDFRIFIRDNTHIARYLSVPLFAHVVDMVSVGEKLISGLVQQIENPDLPLRREIIAAERQHISSGTTGGGA